MNANRGKWIALLLAASAVLGACGMPDQVRKDSETLALYVNSVKQQAEEFKKGRDAIDQARLRNATLIEDSALRAEHRVLGQRTEWEITQSKERIALFDGVRNGVTQLLQQRKELSDARDASAKAVAGANSAVSFRQDKLAEVSAALAKLAEEKDAKAEFAFYKGFFKQVGQNLKDAQARADKAADAGKKGADGKADEKSD